jgi:hypothetical protein
MRPKQLFVSLRTKLGILMKVNVLASLLRSLCPLDEIQLKHAVSEEEEGMHLLSKSTACSDKIDSKMRDLF